MAAEHTVEARPNNMFSPANLSIATGDSVSWVNTGGFHNVVADDFSFRCANGCGSITICEADLVVADLRVFSMEIFTAPNTITTGPAFTVFPTGNATLVSSVVVLGNGTEVLDGGKLTVENATPLPCAVQ